MIRCCSIISAYPQTLKLGFAIQTNCLQGNGFLRVSSHAYFTAALIALNLSKTPLLSLFASLFLEVRNIQSDFQVALGSNFLSTAQNSPNIIFLPRFGQKQFFQSLHDLLLCSMIPTFLCSSLKVHFGETKMEFKDRQIWTGSFVAFKKTLAFQVRSSVILGATPTSSKFCAHWAALLTASTKYRVKLENVGSSLLSESLGMLPFCIFLLPVLKACVPTDL